ncbi:hypothetical protein PPYR_01426 [Photinus pyralis]|uniref:Uncharacterized protein n=1 Tax=Photinus pyralis TaxID=7054 RepID=A0A5N4B4G1_PHOPY|nr:hypothetical protein PPYR_01426 [Photinus pyralis]
MNRLADPIFLHHAKLKATDACHYCLKPRCDAMHMVIKSPQVQGIWQLVRRTCDALLYPRTTTLCMVISGIRGKKETEVLANFLISFARSTIYNITIKDIENDKRTPNFKDIFTTRIKKRIITELAWYRSKDSIEKFVAWWGINNVFCSLNKDKCLTWGECWEEN